MKAWLIYWCIGCAVLGLPMGALLKECPEAKASAADMMVVVALWPAIIVAVVVSGPTKTGSKCPAPQT